MTGGITPAGSSRAMRLDPLLLPMRVAAVDPTADGNTRIAEIDRERVVVMRSVRGVRMRLNLPVDHFLGVSVRTFPGNAAADGRMALVLEHRDAALCVPLQYAAETEDIDADLRLWAHTLGRPLLTSAPQAIPATPVSITISTSAPRRRRRTALKKRRPTIHLRRMWGRVRIAHAVHRNEREIIAPE
jgi:hypothetical protein